MSCQNSSLINNLISSSNFPTGSNVNNGIVLDVDSSVGHMSNLNSSFNHCNSHCTTAYNSKNFSSSFINAYFDKSTMNSISHQFGNGCYTKISFINMISVSVTDSYGLFRCDNSILFICNLIFYNCSRKYDFFLEGDSIAKSSNVQSDKELDIFNSTSFENNHFILDNSFSLFSNFYCTIYPNCFPSIKLEYYLNFNLFLFFIYL